MGIGLAQYVQKWAPDPPGLARNRTLTPLDWPQMGLEPLSIGLKWASDPPGYPQMGLLSCGIEPKWASDLLG